MTKLQYSRYEYLDKLQQLHSLGLSSPLLSSPTFAPQHHLPFPAHLALPKHEGSGVSEAMILAPIQLGGNGELITLTSQASEAQPSLSYRIVSVPDTSAHHGFLPPPTAVAQPPTTCIVSPASSDRGLVDLPRVSADLLSSAVKPSAFPALQLQTVDTPNGQCYLIMGGGEQGGSRQLSGGPKFQQATFIPLGLPSAQEAPKAAAPAADTPYKGKRRACHNEVEKRRRDKINNWIDTLNKLLPESEESTAGAAEAKAGGLAPSKGLVLAKAVDFVRQLKDTNRELVGRVEAAAADAAALAADNRRLREELAALQPPPPKRRRPFADPEVQVDVS